MLDPECVRCQALVDGRRWVKQYRPWGVGDQRRREGGAQKSPESPGERWPLGGLQASRGDAGRMVNTSTPTGRQRLFSGLLVKEHDLAAAIERRQGDMPKSPMTG